MSVRVMLGRGSNLARNSAQQGLALVSVLWLLLLLSAVVLSLVRESRLSIQSASVFADELKIKAELEGAVYDCIYQLATGARETQILQKMRSLGYAARIDYEHSKLNLNMANESELAAYFTAFGVESADAVAARTVDFRDKDDDAREGGSERSIFQREGISIEPKNDAFHHVFELAQIPGLQAMTDEFFQGLTVQTHRSTQAPLITVKISKTLGRSRQGSRVTFRINASPDEPFTILRWDWTAA